MQPIPQYLEIRSQDNRFLWHEAYYDRPLSGMMLWKGEMVWFQEYDERSIEVPADEPDEDSFIEIVGLYNVYRLTPEILQIKIHNHEICRKLIGTHNDYNPDYTRNIGSLNPNWKANWDQCISQQLKYNFVLSDFELIGKFEY
jgi:hypothetical protein